MREGHLWLTDAPRWGADIDDRVLREHPARAERWLTKDFA